MTIQQLAEKQNIKPESINKKLKRKGFPTFSKSEQLPEDALSLLTAKNGTFSGVTTHKNKDRRSQRNYKPQNKGVNWSKVLQVLPLPMLGLAASYGVYYFAAQFVPTFVAIAEAAAFELTYIGLSSMKGLPDRLQTRARRVAIMAVVVSVTYNTLAGAIHMNETILENLSLFWFWFLATVHGAPLATLAYFVADLIFHQKK